jgi:uncharacterized protein GlcG (DUF336 family)
MDLLALAKTIADRVEAEASRIKIPVAVCVIDVHGNVVLHHRMSGAPAFAIELAERKAYTSALVGMRTADILPLVQPGQALFPLMSQGKYCAMGGGAPLSSEGERLAGVWRQRRLCRAGHRHLGGGAPRSLSYGRRFGGFVEGVRADLRAGARR